MDVRGMDVPVADGPAMHQPMDPRAAESLLRRLAERFGESERLYGEALEELHSRLGRLSQTTNDARDTGAPSDADTFERLHAQVSDLVRRLEGESSTPLDNFERLGKALAGGMRGDLEDGAPDAYSTAPEPSPFARSILASKPRSHLVPDLDLAGGKEQAALLPHSAPQAPASGFGAENGFGKELAEMAGRLEQSIDTAMPTGTIEALNSRLEDIGNQIAQALEAGPRVAALDHVESHITVMSQPFSRAEAQLSRIDGVEEHLLTVIARLDEKDAAATSTQVDPIRLQEMAAKAATDAARLVAGDTEKTTERLDAMQRELTTMGEKNGESGDRLVSTLEALHESLKQLVRQVETPQPAESHTPLVAAGTPAPEAPAAPPSQPSDQDVPWARASRSKKPEASQTPAPDARTDLDVTKGNGVKASLKDAETGITETSRERLRARVLWLGETDRLGETDPAQISNPSNQAGEDTAGDSVPAALPDDLVAAARHAAQAAAARAEKRASMRSPPAPAERAADEQPANRRRPLLIISATVLLAISALLLYGRLGTKTAPEGGETTAPAATTQPQADGDQAPAAPKSSSPAPSTAPKPANGTKDGSTGRVPHRAIGTANFSGNASPGGAPRRTPQLASLTPAGAGSLPAGVVFAIENPSSTAKATRVEALPAGIAQASPLVTRTQELLGALGYDVGSPDGLIGDRTSSGIKAFQQRNGLEQTGEVTIPLVRMLERHAN